jgi:AraC family transcriptional regulator
VTGSKTPYELRWRSPAGAELDLIHLHLAVDQCLAAFARVYPDQADAVEVTEFFGRDETLAHLSFACAEMLSARTAGQAKRVAAFAQLLALHLAEQYTNVATAPRPDHRGGLPIGRLRKIEDYVRGHLAESIQIEALAELAELSPFHFARVFKQATGMTPHQFVTRERMLRAQQLIRETARSLIDIALEVGYTSPSHFAQVFRREVGMVPTQFRHAL